MTVLYCNCSWNCAWELLETRLIVLLCVNILVLQSWSLFRFRLWIATVTSLSLQRWETCYKSCITEKVTSIFVKNKNLLQPGYSFSAGFSSTWCDKLIYQEVGSFLIGVPWVDVVSPAPDWDWLVGCHSDPSTWVKGELMWIDIINRRTKKPLPLLFCSTLGHIYLLLTPALSLDSRYGSHALCSTYSYAA